MDLDPGSVPAATPERFVVELRREGYTMALYVAICLLGALLALPEDEVQPRSLQVVWGVTIGLAAAHWFAFRLSTRLVAAGTFGRSDVRLATAQLLAAAAVAVLATIVILIFPEQLEVVATELLLGALVALAGFVAVRGGGVSRLRAFLYALVLLMVAVALALLKNWLTGH